MIKEQIGACYKIDGNLYVPSWHKYFIVLPTGHLEHQFVHLDVYQCRDNGLYAAIVDPTENRWWQVPDDHDYDLAGFDSLETLYMTLRLTYEKVDQHWCIAG